MMTRADRQPIVVADAGPPIRLAADYDLKPALMGEIDPDQPVDLRRRPQPFGNGPELTS